MRTDSLHRRRQMVVPVSCATVWLAAVWTLTACGQSGADGASRPTYGPGSMLTIGQAAVVDFVSSKGSGQLRITPTKIEKGTVADLAKLTLSAEDKQATPYYLRLTIENVSPVDMSGDSPTVKLKGVDSQGTRRGDVTLHGTFDKCRTVAAPRDFGQDKSYQTCLVYLLKGAELSGLQYAPPGTPYEHAPVTWKRP